MRKILFIVEGEKGETKLVNLIDKIFLKCDKNNFEYVVYGTDIYNLYKELKKDNYLDVVSVVKDYIKNKDIETYNKLNKGGYGEVYLIFDLEPQAKEFSYEKIEEMINFFNEETEHGKLYVNYPMVESYKHFKTLPDPNFKYYVYPVNDCDNNGYKQHIHKISCINNIENLNREEYIIILKQVMEKYEYILKCNISNSKQEYNKNFSQQKLLYKVKTEHNTSGNIIVINTFCLWPIEYFNEKFFRKIIRRS